MSNYYEETIENITEQLIEQEILEDIAEIRQDAIDNVNAIRDDAIENIGIIEQDAIEYVEEVRVYTIGENGDSGEVNGIKSEALEYIEENKTALASFGNDKKSQATQTYEDIIEIKEDTDAIDENTISEIEVNIRQMIIDNGYVMKIECDEYGNANMMLTKEVV